MGTTIMNWSAIYPELLLLTMACVIALVDLFVTDAERRPTFWLTQATLVVFALMHFVMFDGERSVYAMQGLMVSDSLGHLLACFAAIACAVTVAYARPYIGARDMLKGEFFTLTLFVLLGVSVMVSANNFLVVYLGLEVMSLSLYALTALRRDHAMATEAAMKYFVLGALASGFLLYGLSMMYGATGSLDHQRVFEVIGKGQANQAVLVFGVVFIVAGLAFKFGAAPFHMWVPDVYHGAPSAVTLFVGTAPKLASFALAYRLFASGLGGVSEAWVQMLGIVAALSMVAGNLIAIAQTNLKRMLAYSAIGNVGFILAGFVAGTEQGYEAALYYTLVYVLMALGSFGVILLASRAGFEADELAHYRGLHQRDPWLALMMLMLMFSTAGVPPFVGFWAKLQIFQVLWASGHMALVLIGASVSVIGLFYYLRIVKLMYFDEPGDLPGAESRTGVRLTLGLNALAVLALGLVPNALLSLCARVLS